MVFTQQVEAWFLQNSRDLPWRNTKDPYLIWLSEVVLQQTRVAQGLPYYLKISKRYKTINELAKAEESEVLRMWQGLGYYSRARNLLKAAREIVKTYESVIPNNYETLLSISGIGSYTAAAIMSFAFDQAYPVIDGNVQRVITRYFGIKEPIDTASGLRQIKANLHSVFDVENPGLFNQAIMELGSQICTPRKAQCNSCPLSSSCIAREQNLQNELPVKKNKTKVKELKMSYFVITFESKTYIEQRSSGFWRNLYQFPLIEGEKSSVELLQELSSQVTLPSNSLLNLSHSAEHVLSHRRLQVDFYTIAVNSAPILLNSHIFEIEIKELVERYPVPVLIDRFLSTI